MTDGDSLDQRYYASTYGRFNTADPKRRSAHTRTPLSWNRYSYTAGDPINRNDPTGLDYIFDCDPDTTPAELITLRLALLDEYDAGGSALIDTDGGGSVTVSDTADPVAPVPSDDGSDDSGSTDGGDTSVGGSDAGNMSGGGGGSNPCALSFAQRATMFGNGLLNLAVAGTKITGAAAVETGSSGVLTGLALYGVYSAAGNITTGLIQTVGAFMPNAGLWQQAGSVSAAAGSIPGLVTLVATNGDVSAGVSAARWDGILQFGLKGGLGRPPSLLSTTATANSAYRVASSGGAKPSCK